MLSEFQSSLILFGKGEQSKINTSAAFNKHAVEILPALPSPVLHYKETGFAVAKLSVSLLWVCLKQYEVQ